MTVSLPSQRSVSSLKMPPALVIIGFILVVAAIATLVLPPGEYQRVERNFPNWMAYTIQPNDSIETISEALGAERITIDSLRLADDRQRPVASLVAGTPVLVPVGGMMRTAVVPNSYQPIVTDTKGSFLDAATRAAGNVLLAPIIGFVDKAQIIGFVMLIGGSFGVILATGAIDRGLTWVVVRLGDGKAKWAVIPTRFVLFSLGGAVFGMGEGTIAFVLITVPLALRLGYDTITGIAMCYMASQVGFAGAFFNPFTIGIAQGIAELPYLSGLVFRYVVWAVVTFIGIVFTMWWALRVERVPERSPTFLMDEVNRRKLDGSISELARRPTLSQWLVICVAFGSVFASGYGVAKLGWFIDEMAALFVGAALLCAVLTRFSPSRTSDEFVKGATLMIEPAMIIACSAGIVIVLQRGQVMDTILYHLAQPLELVSPGFGSVAMMLFQMVLNFFVPSGSGQAAMPMPLITPLCDLMMMNRQVGVLAFQFGDGFGNLVVPTSAVLMGVLGAAKVPWLVWVRWVFPFVFMLHVIGAIFLIIATNGPASWLD